MTPKNVWKTFLFHNSISRRIYLFIKLYQTRNICLGLKNNSCHIVAFLFFFFLFVCLSVHLFVCLYFGLTVFFVWSYLSLFVPIDSLSLFVLKWYKKRSKVFFSKKNSSLSRRVNLERIEPINQKNAYSYVSKIDSLWFITLTICTLLYLSLFISPISIFLYNVCHIYFLCCIHMYIQNVHIILVLHFLDHAFLSCPILAQFL